MMRTFDVLLGGFRAWRRWRGGKWEHLSASCACPVDSWDRVDVFRPQHWPTVIAREDHRRFS
jgi:hypothetical protein